MQPIFLSLGMGAAPIPDDVKFHIVVVKCEWSQIAILSFDFSHFCIECKKISKFYTLIRLSDLIENMEKHF